MILHVVLLHDLLLPIDLQKVGVVVLLALDLQLLLGRLAFLGGWVELLWVGVGHLLLLLGHVLELAL